MIEPKCFKCKNKLDDYGAILLSNPEGKEDPMTVLKYHLCTECYESVLLFISNNPK